MLLSLPAGAPPAGAPPAGGAPAPPAGAPPAGGAPAPAGGAPAGRLKALVSELRHFAEADLNCEL
ncbi:MAG TPA: hypothetical protein VIJ50_00960, partial [Solirubrobacteraceae bacterium]